MVGGPVTNALHSNLLSGRAKSLALAQQQPQPGRFDAFAFMDNVCPQPNFGKLACLAGATAVF